MCITMHIMASRLAACALYCLLAPNGMCTCSVQKVGCVPLLDPAPWSWQLALHDNELFWSLPHAIVGLACLLWEGQPNYAWYYAWALSSAHRPSISEGNRLASILPMKSVFCSARFIALCWSLVPQIMKPLSCCLLCANGDLSCCRICAYSTLSCCPPCAYSTLSCCLPCVQTAPLGDAAEASKTWVASCLPHRTHVHHVMNCALSY